MNNATNPKFFANDHVPAYGIFAVPLAVSWLPIGQLAFMDWITIYIKGREGFKPIVLARLKEVILHGSSLPDQGVLMVWAKRSKSLRSIKQVIGAETIFRYRLRLFTNLNEHLETTAMQGYLPLSVREGELLQKIRKLIPE